MTEQPSPFGTPLHVTTLVTPRTIHRGVFDAELPPSAASRPGYSIAAPAVQVDRDERRVTVRGELDLASVPILTDVLVLLGDTHPGDTTINIGGLSFIDAAGIGCLVDFAHQHAAAGSKTSLVGASPRVRRVFDIVQLSGLLQAG